MTHRLSILASILSLAWLASCQPVPPSVGITSPADLRTVSPTIAASVTSVDTPVVSSGASAPATAVDLSPLSISAMRAKAYPGSELVIETTLSPGSGYNRYIVSYQSDGLRLLGLLTVPQGNKPAAGWPVILLNHGYIPPPEYSTEHSYSGIVAPLAAAGYIVFKPDYRGNGNSAGMPSQPYISPDYVTDSLNALASIEKYKDADPTRIGVWGHSMGGNITLHELVLTHDLKAGVIMAGVVGSYTGILDWWDQRVATGVLTTQNDLETDQLVLQMVAAHGTPQSNPDFWNPLDPTYFISDIQAPVQIQVGSADGVVPPSFSAILTTQLQSAGKSVAYHVYPGADHNLSPYTGVAMAEAVKFFDQYLK